jgi:hypothetical protein
VITSLSRKTMLRCQTIKITSPSIHVKKLEPIRGFPRIAHNIASDLDKTAALFRRFDRLSARNLLYQEVELAELEAQQNTFDDQDLARADPTILESHTSWSKFERHAKEKNADGTFKHSSQAAKMGLVVKIRERLNKNRRVLEKLSLDVHGHDVSNR